MIVISHNKDYYDAHAKKAEHDVVFKRDRLYLKNLPTEPFHAPNFPSLEKLAEYSHSVGFTVLYEWLQIGDRSFLCYRTMKGYYGVNEPKIMTPTVITGLLNKIRKAYLHVDYKVEQFFAAEYPHMQDIAARLKNPVFMIGFTHHPENKRLITVNASHVRIPILKNMDIEHSIPSKTVLSMIGSWLARNQDHPYTQECYHYLETGSTDKCGRCSSKRDNQCQHKDITAKMVRITRTTAMETAMPAFA